jgi:hypothetical protein
MTPRAPRAHAVAATAVARRPRVSSAMEQTMLARHRSVGRAPRSWRVPPRCDHAKTCATTNLPSQQPPPPRPCACATRAPEDGEAEHFELKANSVVERRKWASALEVRGMAGRSPLPPLDDSIAHTHTRRPSSSSRVLGEGTVHPRRGRAKARQNPSRSTRPALYVPCHRLDRPSRGGGRRSALRESPRLPTGGRRASLRDRGKRGNASHSAKASLSPRPSLGSRAGNHAAGGSGRSTARLAATTTTTTDHDARRRPSTR